ncbi:ran GTPase-activating protein 1-like [Mytilus trossulus]|uniref:ran GTPase-activating protein 1-like n=1 Tax=Mytilus trossulus TaxID=6551 RepID=UPI0030040823
MSSKDLTSVTEQLAKTKVNETYELSFKNKGLKLNSAADVKDIVNEIEKCKTMTALRMEGNTLGVEAAEELSKALAKHPEFQRALWSDMFTGRLKTEIPQALKHLGGAIMSSGAGLVELDLSDNAFGPLGVEGLVELLKSSSCYTLQELRLNNNGLGIGGGKMLSQSLLDCHKTSCQAGKPLALKVFVCGRNRQENEGAIALAQAFKAIGTLEEISMPQNGIHHPGITALAEALSVNKQIKILNLNDNTFTKKGSQSIAKVLPNLQNLEVINFGDCLIKTDGAKILAKSLKGGHKKLKELNLSGNEIMTDGAMAIAESMEGKDKLTKLDLNCNMLGENGVEELKGTMEAMDKVDLLASLSDDEGSADEDDVEDEDGEEEEDEAQEDQEGDIINDPELQVKGKGITPKKQAVSAKDFLAFPSPQKLKLMGKQKADNLIQELGNEITDLDRVMQTFLRMSSIVTKDDVDTKDSVCECAEKLIEETLKSDHNTGSMLANSILVSMGILKGEDKKYKPPSTLMGPLLVLEHLVKQPFFPKFSREILSMFMSKPHPLLDQSKEARHKLLQTLMAY